MEYYHMGGRNKKREEKLIELEEEEEEEEEEDADQKLDLSGLSLHSIPKPSINLSAITNLNISNNNLEAIPESVAARLVNVVVLDVHSNQLAVLPNSIGCLSNLKLLNVSGNLLESLPKTIEDCRSLEELNANFNKLIKLPDTIGINLINLRKLSVNSNKLASLPFSTSHMTSLRVLDARLNCLRSLPEDLHNLIRLEVLNVSQNFQFLELLPHSVGLLVSLVELDISYNRITHLPHSVACLSKLQKLKAEGNPLVFPPVEVIEQSVEAVRDYLSVRGEEPAWVSPRKKTWLRKLVKCKTFTSGTTVPSRGGIVEEHEGFLQSDYRSIDVGITPPRNTGVFSPRRLFAPRTSLRK